jgi:cation transport ATPase
MKLDEQIKHELEQEAQRIDQIVAHDPGMFTMLLNAYKGSLGVWIIPVSIVTLLVTAILFWSGYQFFFDNAQMVEHKGYWGFVMLLSAMVQIALKMWTFMEMNRQSTNREIKRLELAIERLQQVITGSAANIPLPKEK